MTDLDLPLVPSADQIRRREFATVRRGYDPDQVRDYLQQVAGQVEALERAARERKLAQADEGPAEREPERAALVAEPVIAEPVPGDDAYDALAKRFSSLIATADREAARVLEDAKAEAASILEEARSEADRIRVDAQARAEEARQQGTEALAQAREEADRLLSSLAERRESLVSQMHEMRTKLLAVAGELGSEMDEADRAPGDASDAAEAPGGDREDDLVDPRYEDLWADPRPSAGAVDIPDLAAIDLDLDDEPPSD